MPSRVAASRTGHRTKTSGPEPTHSGSMRRCGQYRRMTSASPSPEDDRYDANPNGRRAQNHAGKTRASANTNQLKNSRANLIALDQIHSSALLRRLRSLFPIRS